MTFNLTQTSREKLDRASRTISMSDVIEGLVRAQAGTETIVLGAEKVASEKGGRKCYFPHKEKRTLSITLTHLGRKILDEQLAKLELTRSDYLEFLIRLSLV